MAQKRTHATTEQGSAFRGYPRGKMKPALGLCRVFSPKRLWRQGQEKESDNGACQPSHRKPRALKRNRSAISGGAAAEGNRGITKGPKEQP